VTEVETERLWLRPWRAEDEAQLVRLFTDPEVMRHIAGRPLTLAEVAEVAERTLQQWERNRFGPWAAIEKATGRWVGRIGLNELPDWPGPHKVEVGWELDPACWGRGLATEGGLAGVGYGFGVVGLERIISVTVPANRASWRVMEKCGLRRQGERDFRGARVVWYALDRGAWQATQAAKG
jgi:RimJ/RimL family protein N-acetyltransferase